MFFVKINYEKSNNRYSVTQRSLGDLKDPQQAESAQDADAERGAGSEEAPQNLKDAADDDLSRRVQIQTVSGPANLHQRAKSLSASEREGGQ